LHCKSIQKRTITLFCVMLVIVCGMIARLLTLATQSEYVEAAASQSTYRVYVGNSRGRIYDCKMRSLAGGRIEYRAVIEPSSATIQHLTNVMTSDDMLFISDRLTGRSPFIYKTDDAAIAGPGVRVYRCETRYGMNSLAVHTIGYVNNEGRGVAGIEYAFDDYLNECYGEIIAYHTVNSGGRSLSGIEPVVVDTSYKSQGGVVLTLDMDIQQIAETAADKYIDQGAIVVMKADSGEICASVSRPVYDQNDIAASINYKDGRMINRAYAAYDIGSVFKLVVAAAALENGIDEHEVYLCEGSYQIGDNVFHCSNRSGHGEIDMCSAVSSSCNIYFIKIAQQLGGAKIIELADRIGFGREIELADNFSTRSGCLPDKDSLMNPAALANLSFGQGELMATPIHLAQLIAAIANNGVMPETSIYNHLITPSGTKFNEFVPAYVRVMSENTAGLLQEYMKETVVNGTGKAGNSIYVTSAAKTGTAQTGIIKDNRRVLQAWYAGFFPYEQPEYICVVLIEDGQSGGADAGPVFKYIAEELCI